MLCISLFLIQSLFLWNTFSYFLYSLWLTFFKGIVHPKRKWSFTHFHVFSSFSSVEHKRYISEGYSDCSLWYAKRPQNDKWVVKVHEIVMWWTDQNGQTVNLTIHQRSTMDYKKCIIAQISCTTMNIFSEWWFVFWFVPHTNLS